MSRTPFPADGADPLAPEIRQLFQGLEHAGDLALQCATAAGGQIRCGEAGRVQHGTRVRFCLCIAGSRILQARYRAYGCPHTLAVCEWLARRLAGRELDAPSAEGLARAVGTAADWAQALQIPPAKLGRLLVVEDALRAALAAPALLETPELRELAGSAQPRAPAADPAVTKGA